MSTRKSPHHSLRAPSTAKKPLSPYLDLQQLPSHSIVKPSLRKSFGGQASRGRTPYDALKSPGKTSVGNLSMYNKAIIYILYLLLSCIFRVGAGS